MKSIDIDGIAADIDTCRRYIRNHQHSTIECVSFGATGKLTVIDKPRLEELNAEVDRLTSLVGHNESVVTRLEEALGSFPSFAAIKDRRRYVDESISRVQNLLRQDIGNLIKRYPTIDPGQPYDHPEGKRLKDQADARLAEMRPELEKLDEQISKAKAIMQDFQPSELEPMPASTAPAMISREKVSGFGV
jgi:hypothetical protein